MYFYVFIAITITNGAANLFAELATIETYKWTPDKKQQPHLLSCEDLSLFRPLLQQFHGLIPLELDQFQENGESLDATLLSAFIGSHQFHPTPRPLFHFLR